MRAVMRGDATEQPRLEIPFFTESVRAGFPSPAQDYIERTLDNSDDLMMAMDRINASGLGHISFAGQLRTKQWNMQRNRLSPNYTTRWKDLPIAKA